MSGVNDLVTAMHDTLCACGARCHGWHADKAALLEFVEQRWGTAGPFEYYLEAES